MTGRQAHVKAMVDVQKGGKMGRLIDEDDVVDWLLKRTEMYDGTGHFVDKNVVKKNIESQIAKIPSAQPEQKTGKWERAYLDHEAMGERPSILYCSVCNQYIAYPVNFCPNCGADMRGEQDENR